MKKRHHLPGTESDPSSSSGKVSVYGTSIGSTVLGPHDTEAMHGASSTRCWYLCFWAPRGWEETTFGKTSANPKDGLIICTLKPLDRKKTWSCWKTKKNKWTTINHKKINLHRQISLHFTDFFLAFLQAQHLSSDPIGSSTSLAAAARWGPRVELQLRPLPTRRSWKPRNRWRPGYEAAKKKWTLRIYRVLWVSFFKEQFFGSPKPGQKWKLLKFKHKVMEKIQKWKLCLCSVSQLPG